MSDLNQLKDFEWSSTATAGWRPKARLSLQDRVFATVAHVSGAIVLAIMGFVGLFLAIRAGEALSKTGFRFFTTQAWEPDSGNFGIAGILTGTVLIGVFAIVMAVPFAIATALYISEYAPPALQRTSTSLVDLMAAVPSVVYGLWGAFFLQQNAVGTINWVTTYLGWIPFLSIPGRDNRDPLASPTDLKSSTFLAALVVAMMVTPIASSVMREAFSQAPAGERESAYALGATRWGMIRAVVLPYGRGAIIGGTMLGLGRAPRAVGRTDRWLGLRCGDGHGSAVTFGTGTTAGNDHRGEEVDRHRHQEEREPGGEQGGQPEIAGFAVPQGDQRGDRDPALGQHVRLNDEHR